MHLGQVVLLTPILNAEPILLGPENSGTKGAALLGTIRNKSEITPIFFFAIKIINKHYTHVPIHRDNNQ